MQKKKSSKEYDELYDRWGEAPGAVTISTPEKKKKPAGKKPAAKRATPKKK